MDWVMTHGCIHTFMDQQWVGCTAIASPMPVLILFALVADIACLCLFVCGGEGGSCFGSFAT